MPPLTRKLAAASLFLLALACLCLASLAPAARVRAGSAQRREEPRANVYGRAVYEGTGRPVRRARVLLVITTKARPELVGLTDGRGEFRIANVPAGSYFAFADVPGAISPLAFVSVGDLMRGSGPDFSGALKFFDTFETDGREDKQITVHARRGAALSGRVAYADGQLYVKSITWNGRDLLREPLEIGDGTSVEGVQVVFSRNPATLNVRLARAAGKTPPREVTVFLIPANASEWSPYAQHLSCSTGESGCSITAPPGDYAVVALPRLRAPADAEAEIRRRAATAPRVTLRAGETKDFEVAAPAEN